MRVRDPELMALSQIQKKMGEKKRGAAEGERRGELLHHRLLRIR
jgi:hypothetical protein